MNRETILAIVLGVVLGAVVGIGVLMYAPKSEKTKVIPVTPKKNIKSQTKPSQKDTDVVVKVVSPDTNSVTTLSKITLSLIVPDANLVVIQSPVAHITQKSKGEKMNVDFPLALGENSIHITVYGASGSPQEAQLQIYRIEE